MEEVGVVAAAHSDWSFLGVLNDDGPGSDDAASMLGVQRGDLSDAAGRWQ